MKQRLWHFQEGGTAEELLQRKAHCAATISVVIPTLNEASTIEAIVQCIRQELMEETAFVDELIVVDSDSSDATRQIASDAGAQVYRACEIATQHGDAPGKGENLWKSQFVSHGSLVVFLDGDVKNFHRGYVTGLCLPLLEDPAVRFVKAFYQRPLVRDGLVLADEGGRVTELLIRPMLARYRPELCGILQPLSGECAMPRAVMESLAFPQGYAVEIAHLLEVAQRFGVGAIAQCDLGERRHRNRSLGELSEMAHGLLHAFLEACGDAGLARNCFPRATAKQGECVIDEIPLATRTRPAYERLKNGYAM
jgi:glucosyl-3-phosphoglycerate synthase